MRMEDLDYELPADRIAQEPAVEREGARLMHVDRASRRIRHGRIPDLADALVPGDVVVVNDTRVLPARLLGNRVTGGRVELLLIEPTGDAGGSWRAMAHAGGRLTAGETLSFGDAQIVLVDREAPDGLWTVRAVGQTMREVCQHVGSCRCRRTSSARPEIQGRTPTGIGTRRSTRDTRARWPRQPPDCT